MININQSSPGKAQMVRPDHRLAPHCQEPQSRASRRANTNDRNPKFEIDIDGATLFDSFFNYLQQIGVFVLFF
jgi:hypothetical protein